MGLPLALQALPPLLPLVLLQSVVPPPLLL